MLPLMWRLPKYDQRVSFLFEGGGGGGSFVLVFLTLLQSSWEHVFKKTTKQAAHGASATVGHDLFPESPPLVKYISSTSNPEYILNK